MESHALQLMASQDKADQINFNNDMMQKPKGFPVLMTVGGSDVAGLTGGLSMNNPDVLALTEVARRWPERLPQLEMLSIGTAGADAPRDPRGAEKKGLAWVKTLPEYMMLVQERTASAQAARVLGRRYLRVNYTEGRDDAFLDLDVANDRARFKLLDAAKATASVAYRKLSLIHI